MCNIFLSELVYFCIQAYVKKCHTLFQNTYFTFLKNLWVSFIFLKSIIIAYLENNDINPVLSIFAVSNFFQFS